MLWHVEDLVEKSSLSVLDHALHRVWDDEEAFAHHCVFFRIQLPEANYTILLAILLRIDLHLLLIKAWSDIGPADRGDASHHIYLLMQVILFKKRFELGIKRLFYSEQYIILLFASLHIGNWLSHLAHAPCLKRDISQRLVFTPGARWALANLRTFSHFLLHSIFSFISIWFHLFTLAFTLTLIIQESISTRVWRAQVIELVLQGLAVNLLDMDLVLIELIVLIIGLLLAGQDARHKLQRDELVLFFGMRDALVVEPFLVRDSLVIPVLLLLDQTVYKLLSSHGLWQVEVWLKVVCLLLASVGEEGAACLALPNVEASSIALLHELLRSCFGLLLTLWNKLRNPWSVTILIQIFSICTYYCSSCQSRCLQVSRLAFQVVSLR